MDELTQQPAITPEGSQTVQTEEEFMREARELYHQGLEEDREDRAEAREDVRFAAGGLNQWDTDVISARQGDGSGPGRPCLTWNQLSGPIAQVVNEGRANNPAIKASPLDGGNTDTAEFLQDRIRHIEYESDADIAWDTASEAQITCGRGWVRVRTEYKSPRSFDQNVIIEPIEDQFAVVSDPAARRYDRQDMDWCFITGNRLSGAAFKRKYGEEKFRKYSTFKPLDSEKTDYNTEWRADNLYPEVEYWRREYRKDVALQLQTGIVMLKSEYDKQPEEAKVVPIINQREVQVPTVKQFIIDGTQILEENEWIGTTIPVVPWWGRRKVVDGKLRTYGLIRDSKDPQRTINITISSIAELTAQIPKVPVEAAEGSIENPDEWQPNSPKLIRYYKTEVNGRPVPPPTHPNLEPPIQALTLQLRLAIDAVKQGTSVFNASLGDRSNETSGIAINQRKVESDTANYNFADNGNRSRRAVGRIVLELLKKLDAGRKKVPVRDAQGQTTLMEINTPEPVEVNGKKKHIQIDKGEYDVAISTGPSYTSQREQTVAIMSEMAKTDPALMPTCGDIFYSNLDAAGAQQIADRYAEGIIPEQFRKKPEGAPTIPPQVLQQMQQMKQLADQLTQQLNAAKDELQTKSREQDVRLQIANIQAETQRTIALATLDQKQGLALLEAELSSIRHTIELDHAVRMQANDQTHQLAMQAEQPDTNAAVGGEGQPQSDTTQQEGVQ